MVTLAEIEDALDRGPRRRRPGTSSARWPARRRFAARSAIVAELERLELLDKIEPHIHQVPHGDRGGVPIEPLLTTQWYCNAGVLAKPAIEAVESGRDRVRPASNGKTPSSPGCATSSPGASARQLWWGHRIPAWYGPDGAVFVAKRRGTPPPTRRAPITAATKR